MAKTKLPLLSATAQGTFARLIEYSKRHGQNLVRYQKEKKDSNTGAQTSERALFSQAINAWHTLTPDEQQQWSTFNETK